VTAEVVLNISNHHQASYHFDAALCGGVFFNFASEGKDWSEASISNDTTTVLRYSCALRPSLSSPSRHRP